MDSSRVRYLEDAPFHKLVDAIAHAMKDFNMAPSDIKEAADVAIDINTENLRRRLREYEA